MKGLSLKNIKKTYGAVDVIKGVDLDIEPGEFVVFVGPSGCGKSTLLRMIAGLEDITEGDLTIGDARMNDVDPSKRGIAMVFQSYALYPHLTVSENMGLALKYAGFSKSEIKEKVEAAADTLGLMPLLDRRPKDLSGGQRQRVAIGRSIVRQPDVFLFDEPLSNLDAELRVQMRIELAHLHQRLNSTIIYVTHDQVEAMTLADKIVVLRDGIIEQVGRPLDLYDTPCNTFVAGFIGSPRTNFLQAEATEDGFSVLTLGGQTIGRPNGLKALEAGTKVTLGIRPEHFDSDGTEALTLEVDIIEQLGGQSYAYATAADSDHVAIALGGDRSVQNGQTLEARFNLENLMVFDESGIAISHA